MYVWDSIGLYLNQKDLKSGMKKLSYGPFTNGRLCDSSILLDVWDSLGHHWNKKDIKSGMKMLSYGQFTNGRLRDSCEYHFTPLVLNLVYPDKLITDKLISR